MKIPLVLTEREPLQQKIAKASETLYQMAKAGYGPGAGNAILGFRHGPPMLSRDGVTNIKQVRSEDAFEDDIIQAIREVSEKNNQKVGDGTTAVVILAYHLYTAARILEAQHINPMEIAARLKAAEQIVLKQIDEIKQPIGERLEQIATVSAGDPDLGAMIADIMKEVGVDGGVIIEQYEGLGVHNELINGFYINRGYKDTDLINNPSLNQSSHVDVPILISNKTFNTNVDIGPVLDSINKAGFKEVIMVGEVQNEALQTLKLAKGKGVLLVVPIDPPYAVGGRTLFLDDIALMTGAKVYDGTEFDAGEYLGEAKEVLVNGYSTTIVGGDGKPTEVAERVKSLKEQLEEETHPQSIQFIKDRLARLTNKMAIIKVGGAIEFERDEVKLRVQDAVCAVQSALKDGILPGGGVFLARVTGTEFDDAFKQPFKQLVANSGKNPEALLPLVEAAGVWEGFNLRNMTDKPVDLLEQGIIDPSLVIKEIVTNAVSVVSGLITANAAIAWDKEQKE